MLIIRNKYLYLHITFKQNAMKTKLKTTKETSKTFTMTFEFNDIDELKELKALSILLGNFNPMRKEMTNGNAILDILQEEKENSVLSNIVLKISNQLI